MNQHKKLSQALRSLETYKESHLVPSYFLAALKDLRDVVSAPAGNYWRRGFDAMRARAVEIADSYCRDVPEHVDVQSDKNTFAAGYLVAAGGIRDALKRNAELPAVTEAGEQECELERVLSLLISYGAVHTVNGVTYPEGSHAEALKTAERIRDRLRAGYKVPPSTSAAIRAAAREWMNTWHGAFATNKEREDALVGILSRYFGKGETERLPICPNCQQGYVCEHCGKPIGNYYTTPAALSPGEPRVCVKCGHSDGVDQNGWCLHNRPYNHDPATSLCGCKCEPLTAKADNDGEPQYVEIDGERRLVIPCPDGKPDCEVLHTATLRTSVEGESE